MNSTDLYGEYYQGEEITNSTEYPYYYYYYDDKEDYFPSSAVTVAVLTIFGVVLLTGIVGNILVLVVIAAVKSMHTTVNKCLFSLGVADLIVLVLMPIQPISNEFANNMAFLGRNFCSFLIFYERGAVVCSVCLFLYMTIDRYMALCHPLNPRNWSSGKRTYVIITGIWIFALVSSIPYIYMTNHEVEKQGNETYYYCNVYFFEAWQEWYETGVSLLIFYVPIPFLAFLYGRMIWTIRGSVSSGISVQSGTVSGQRGRNQVVAMLLAVVVVFLVCQLPYTTIILLSTHFPQVFRYSTLDKKTFIIVWTCHILVFVNSAANPIIYLAFSSNFRAAFLRLFGCSRKPPQRAFSGISFISSST